MYIDSLTIAGLIVFAIALGVFIHACLMHDCGTGYRDYRDADNGEHHYKL